MKAASEVDGIACVLTYEDVPDKRFTMAGQTYPEPSPYDRLILDRRMRFVGDAAAVVAGETEEAVDHALRLIKVEYEVLEPVLDFGRRRITRFWSIRKKTGRASVRLERITNVICALAAERKTVTWIARWNGASM